MTYTLNIGGPGSAAYARRWAKIEEQRREEEQRPGEQVCPQCGANSWRITLGANWVGHTCTQCDYSQCGVWSVALD